MGDGDGDVIGGKDVLIERERTLFFYFLSAKSINVVIRKKKKTRENFEKQSK